MNADVFSYKVSIKCFKGEKFYAEEKHTSGSNEKDDELPERVGFMEIKEGKEKKNNGEQTDAHAEKFEAERDGKDVVFCDGDSCLRCNVGDAHEVIMIRVFNSSFHRIHVEKIIED